MVYLYKNWAKFSLLLALIVLSFLFAFSKELSGPLFWIWIQFPIYLIHEFEEHVWPGHFKEFVNREVFHSRNPDMPLDNAGVFWINILVIWIFFPLAAILAQVYDPKIGSFLPYFGLFNATTHIIGFFVKRKYNPGLFASVFLNYPLGIYALVVLAENGDLPRMTSVLSLSLSLLIHLTMIAYVFHRYRSKIKG